MKLGIGLIPLIRPKQQKKKKSDPPRTHEDNGDSKNGKIAYNDESLRFIKGSLIKIKTKSLSKSPVVIGRSQLLTSYCAACNIDILPGAKRQKSCYLETFRWATKALSREMLRFSEAGMQIRGKHAIVRVNRNKILSTAKANYHTTGNVDSNSIKNQNVKGSQKDEWSTDPVIIVPGDILSFEPRVGQALCSRLEFIVVSLDQRMKNEKVATMTDKNDLACGNIVAKVDQIKHDEGEQENGAIPIDNLSTPVIEGDNCRMLKVNETVTCNSPNSRFTNPSKLSFLVYFFPFGNGTYDLF